MSKQYSLYFWQTARSPGDVAISWCQSDISYITGWHCHHSKVDGAWCSMDLACLLKPPFCALNVADIHCFTSQQGLSMLFIHFSSSKPTWLSCALERPAAAGASLFRFRAASVPRADLVVRGAEAGCRAANAAADPASAFSAEMHLHSRA